MQAKDQIGRRIVVLRHSRGLSQIELARMVGIHPQSLSCIERGEKRPRRKTLGKIAAVFDLLATDLLKEVEVRV